MDKRHYDCCECGTPKKRTSRQCRRCANTSRGQTYQSEREDFGYFPKSGAHCLVAVRGFTVTPERQTGGAAPERVVFTLCENSAPFRELEHFRPVRVEHAETRRLSLIREHCDPNYRPELRVKRIRG